MSACQEKVPIWRIVLLFIACLSVYMYLYTNAFDNMRTSSVYRVVEGDLQAVLKDKIGSISYYLRLMEQSDNSLKIAVSSSAAGKPTINTTRASAVTTKPTTKAPTTQSLASISALLREKFKSEIEAGTVKPLLTLFTSWNENSEKSLVHKLTVTNWNSLKPFIVPLIFTNDSSVAKECSNSGWEARNISVAAADGIPVLKYMYKDAIANYNSTFYAYANGDILFNEKLVNTLMFLLNSTVDLSSPVLIVGRRTNVDNVTYEEGSAWDNITKAARSRGKLFTGWAEDYFITTRGYPWKDIAEVVIGRRAYDNWLVYHSRKSKFTVIDVSMTVLAVHQTTKSGNFEGHQHPNRDYNHNLLVKMYKRIKYNAGVIECIDKATEYEHNVLQVKTRKVHNSCSV
ncbi:hypothetical protein ACF0H5_006349 [Mactra antiquata]